MSNDYAAIFPEVWARRALEVLHNNCVMPGLVTRNYDTNPQNVGDTINIQVPGTFTVGTNSADSVSYQDTDTENRTVTIDQWKYVKFYVSDKDLALAMQNPEEFFRIYLDPAAKAMADHVDQALLQLYKDVYWAYGTAGDPPDAMADLIGILSAAQYKKIPTQGLNFVMGPACWADVMAISNINKINEGQTEFLRTGQLGSILGMNLFMDQNVDSTSGAKHTVGGWVDATTPRVDDAAFAAGDTAVHIDGLGTSITGEVADGDLLLFNASPAASVAANAISYAVTAAANSDSNGDADIVITPGSASAYDNDTTIGHIRTSTSVNTYINNMAFAQDAFAFVARPLGSMGEMFGGARQSSVVQDDVPLRLTIGYDHTKPGVYVMLDLLYGAKAVRPEKAIRILG